jgi:hypothetical protein
MTTEGGKGDIVKVDETLMGDARTDQHDRHPTAEASAADDHDGGFAPASDARLVEERSFGRVVRARALLSILNQTQLGVGRIEMGVFKWDMLNQLDTDYTTHPRGTNSAAFYQQYITTFHTSLLIVTALFDEPLKYVERVTGPISKCLTIFAIQAHSKDHQPWIVKLPIKEH